MKKAKFLGTLVAIGVIGGLGYNAVDQQKLVDFTQKFNQIQESRETQEEVSELTSEESTQEVKEEVASSDSNEAAEVTSEVSAQDLEQVEAITHKIEVASRAFESVGMKDTYGRMRSGQKKKWLKLINENDYFGDDAMQYQISNVYELGDNQYYIIGWSAPKADILKIADKWSEAEKETHLAKEAFELVLSEENGNYFATKAIYPSEQILSSDEVALYKKEEQAESNVDIQYKKVNKLNGVNDYVDYLDKAISGIKGKVNGTVTLNDAGQSEVTQYVQYAIENLATTKTEAKENVIDVKPELIKEMKSSMTTAKDQFNKLLNDNDMSFNKSLNTVLKLQVEDTNFKKPIFIQLPKKMDDLEGVTGLRVVIDENSYIYIPGEDLEALAGLKIRIERLHDKKGYDISFINENAEIIPQLEQTITFAFKAKDEFTTVVKINGEEEQNWGGQYENATSSISFGTKYSGIYKIVDNNVKIRDIAHLPSKQQSAIKFMVSKGYLTLENDCFNPEHTFSRYEFAEALVKMFFALDTSLQTEFKDVPVDNAYYSYVASGETYDIIKGFQDGTFKGNTKILREQVISLCARTIADQKGYVYPEHTEDYLKFADVDEIGKWAIDDIALAVQSGLITAGGSLTPKTQITKAESAEVLYELFMLLYETTPDNVAEMPIEQKTYSILGTFLVLALALLFIWKVIKRFVIALTTLACTIAIIIAIYIGFGGF
ncbi:S-layer homology domain-containing protein [Cellulosilyticum ruminicola]|uniref:S-layer homology domain-containing protein n=1 Tax=Cellulosilyticum ruminicola TaxID=425254 RepID=UPI0006CFF907|nr:S-layer homology domain-containing protein [Cellulosilyticum ruminicola]